MTSLVLNVVLTVDIPNSKKSAKLHSVKNSLGQDITDAFRNFCKENGFSLNTQSEIEKAVEEFSEKNKTNSALLP